MLTLLIIAYIVIALNTIMLISNFITINNLKKENTLMKSLKPVKDDFSGHTAFTADQIKSLKKTK